MKKALIVLFIVALAFVAGVATSQVTYKKLFSYSVPQAEWQEDITNWAIHFGVDVNAPEWTALSWAQKRDAIGVMHVKRMDAQNDRLKVEAAQRATPVTPTNGVE